MAIGVNSILSMNADALFDSSAGIQGAGVNTPGPSRQTAALNEKYSVTGSPGPIGQSARATEVMRHFDAFIESHYVNKLSAAARWQKRHAHLRSVENLCTGDFSGLDLSINAFFDAWNKLAQGADALLPREELLGQAQAVAATIRGLDAALRALEEQANAQCAEYVAEANGLMREIAQLNTEIAACRAGRATLGKLTGKRAEKVRELATVMDIAVEDRAPGDYVVAMKNGAALVRNGTASALEFRSANVENRLAPASPYRTRNEEGGWNTVRFSGADRTAYTVEILNDGDVGGGVRFRLSLDGGGSWLTGDDGGSRLFNAQGSDAAVLAGALEIWFDPGRLAAGDRFVLSPKSDVYRIDPADEPRDVSARVFTGGGDAPLRVTGGSLGGLLEFRDDNAGEYRDRLDALAKTLAWEVNRIHSRGVGLEAVTSLSGVHAAGNRNAPLGSPEARFVRADRLRPGAMRIAVYDAKGNPLSGSSGLNVLSFDGGGFDPAKHSMSDVVNAVNDPAGECSRYILAEEADGRLKFNARNYSDASGDTRRYSFALTDDATGLAAAFGLNCFFTDGPAASFDVNRELAADITRINAGKVNANGEINTGDSRTADEIAALRDKGDALSFSARYSDIVAKAGSDTRGAGFNAATETAIARELYARQEEVSSVNLDEEMSSLIKFQASYKAAAKLITTADGMLQTLLSLRL